MNKEKFGEQLQKFLLRILRSREFLNRLYATARGTRQANLSTVYIGNLIVRLPSLSHQKELCFKMDDLEIRILELQDIYNEKLHQLNELKKSLLHQAFTGQLTKQKVAA